MAYQPYVNSPGLRKPAPNAKPSIIQPNKGYGLLNPGTTYTPPTKPTQLAMQPPSPGGTTPQQTAAWVPQGTSLPYAGVYLEQQNAAEKAYEDAQTQLQATHSALYHRYGLLDNGQVDPFNRYGDYQTMLGSEGAALDAAREDAIGRGLGSGGLARQGESALRQQQGAEQLGFQQQVLGADSDLRVGLAQALAARNAAFQQAEEQANQDALQKMLADGYFTLASAQSGGGGSDNTDSPGGGGRSTVKDASDALSRYLANNAPPKEAPAPKKNTIFKFK